MKDEYKRKNRFVSIIAIVLLIAILAFFGYIVYKAITETKKEPENQEEVTKDKITPLLYEVSKEGSSNKMYLFGSIHIANKNDLVFPKYVMDAYNKSHYLACEFDIIAYLDDQSKVLKDAMNMLYQDGTTLKDHLSEKTYTKLVKFLKEKKAYNELYENYKLHFFDSLIVDFIAKDAKISSDHGVDEYFLKKAKEDKKTILEVESSDDQFNMFEESPEELYELMINEEIDDYEKSIDKLKELYEAWKSGSIENLLKYGMEDMEILDSYTEEQKKYIEDYNKKLVDDRNKEMLKKAIQYFDNNQDVFFMVGAFHIIGDTGLANGLKQQGFIVKQVK